VTVLQQRFMTHYLSRGRRTPILPRLPRDPRKRQLAMIILVLTVSLIGAGTLATVMVCTAVF